MLDNKKSLISVIIPIFNTELYLKECIESVINQTYQNLEILLIDDGSTDDSYRICKEFEQNDKRVIAIHKDNSGVSDTRNFGIQKATGEYIYFLDSDDWLSVDALEILFNKIEETKSDIGVIATSMKKQNSYSFIPDNKFDVFSKEDVLLKLAKNEWDYTIVSNKLFNKNLFDTNMFPIDMRMTEDKYIMIKLLDKISRVVYTKQACLYVREREESLCRSSNYDERVLDSIKTNDLFTDYIQSNSNKNVLNFHLHSYLRELFSVYSRVLNSTKIKSKQIILKSVKNKIIKTFNSLRLWEWRFKDIKRYILFRISPKLLFRFSTIK